MIPTPEDVGLTGSGVAGWIGGILVAIGTTALGVRSWLSKDAASRKEDSVSIEFLNTIMAQLEKANERADRFAKERNEAIEQIGALKAQIATLQLTVNHMQAQLDRMMGAPACQPQ